MSTLAEIRSQYPFLADSSDDEVVDALHQAFYADLPREIDRLPVDQRMQVKARIAAGGAPPTAATTTPAAASATAPLEAAGQKLDAARAALDTATQSLQTFGQRQRAQNPMAYQAALAAVEAAKAARDQAQSGYLSIASNAAARPAFRYATP